MRATDGRTASFASAAIEECGEGEEEDDDRASERERLRHPTHSRQRAAMYGLRTARLGNTFTREREREMRRHCYSGNLSKVRGDCDSRKNTACIRHRVIYIRGTQKSSLCSDCGKQYHPLTSRLSPEVTIDQLLNVSQIQATLGHRETILCVFVCTPWAYM